jgi:hypothetical protein
MDRCRWRKTWVSKSRGGLANHALARATYRNLESIGAPVWEGEALRAAREIQSNLGIDPLERPFSPDTERLIDPEECERQLRTLMPAWQQHLTSEAKNGIHGANRRRHRRLKLAGSASARGFQGSASIPLARIRDDGARRGMDHSMAR